MRQENLDLCKELAKLLQKGFYIIDGTFENSLEKIEYFYPDVHVSWGRVHLNQVIEDEKIV